MARRDNLLYALMVGAILLGPASPCPGVRYDYTKLYQSGRKAAIEGYPRKALFYLTAALQQKSMEGEPWVVIYGRHQEPYLPHFYLGLAFFDLGEYQKALEEWQFSEEQGAVRETPQYRELLEKRNLIQREILPQTLATARQELENASAVRGQIDDGVAILRALNQDPVDLEQRSGQIAKRLAASRKELESRERENAFQRIEETRRTVASALVETVGLLRKAQERTSRVTASTVDLHLARALEALKPGSCPRDALEPLSLLQRLLASRPDLRTDDREVRLSLGLSRAYLQCKELDSALQHLLAVAQKGLAQDEVARLEQELAKVRAGQDHQDLEELEARDAALADYTEAAAAIDLGECDQEAIRRMQRLAESVRLREDRRQMAAWIAERARLPYLPQIYLAKGYKSCDDTKNALRSLEQSKERREMPVLEYERQADSIAEWIRQKRGQSLYSGSYALVLLATKYDRYRRGWPNLRISEAERENLETKLKAIGFSVVEIVRDPTKRDFEQAVNRFITAFGKGPQNRNRLLIYFAGHGARLDLQYRGESVSLGFLVPVDAERDPKAEDEQEKFIESAVGMDQIDRWARQIEAIHALFVIDSCYSGTVFQEISRSRGGVLPAVVEESIREPVRLFITASNDVKVTPDTTVFLSSLLAAVTWEEDADYDRNQFLTGSELCLFLQDRVTPRTGVEPHCGKMPPPYNRGDLVFAHPTDLSPQQDKALLSTATVEALRQELSAWQKVRSSGNIQDYQAYIQQYPKGRFAGLSSYRLLRLHP